MNSRNLTNGAVSAGWIAWWGLFLLALLYVLSFVDRFILALLVQPIKLEFGASDAQMALLFGTTFALFYAVFGLPLARYADTGNRVLLIMAGVLVWSIATIGSAFAGSFAMLLFLRVGVAVGEATLTPAAYSLIGDMFPPRHRVLAASIYTAAGMAGAGGSYIIGGLIISAISARPELTAATSLQNWQIVLVLVGLPGIVVALLFGLTVGRRSRRAAGRAPATSLKEVWAYFWQNRILIFGLFGGAGFAQAIGYTVFGWIPEVLRREYNWPIENAGFAVGTMGVLAGSFGTILVPQISRFLQARGLPSAFGVTSLASVILGAALAIIALLQSDGGTLVWLLGTGLFFITGATSNIIVSTQEIIPQDRRGLAVAVFLLSITALGLGLGPYSAAFISGLLPEAASQMRHAMILTFLLAAILSSACFILSMFHRAAPEGEVQGA